jgi:iron complex transport system ATP-binding protein
MSSAALKAKLKSVRLQDFEALRDIELQLEPARWTAIVGPNGAGKSTLLRALAGLIPADGEILLLGNPLHDWAPKQRARTLAWLGQNETSADDLTAHDVVMLGRLPHQAWLAAPSSADRQAVHDAMAQTQSWDWRQRRLSTLSGGERQRVLLARALAVQASVLMMDEPLAHLDPPHQADWIDIVRQLVARGQTVVSVLHELNIALQADMLVVMARGQVVHQGFASDASTHQALQQVFDQRLRIAQLDDQWLALPHTPTSSRNTR